MKICYIAAVENIVLANMIDAEVLIIPEIFREHPIKKIE
jgi:hypothetical protein